MHPEMQEIAAHMKDFGLSIMGCAIWNATFSEHMRPFAHALAVVHAAHAAEIILKARVAEEHPLLIFNKLPSASSAAQLSIAELFDLAKTHEYRDLPDLVWATAGHRVRNVDRFQEFGKLRNKLVHFAVPDHDLAVEALRFALEIVEPLIDAFWTTSAIPYAEQWDPDIVAGGYLAEQAKRHRIKLTKATRAILHPKKTNKRS